MKHKLLSILALAGMFVSTSAMAQSWTEPVAVEPAMGEATTPADGGVYFLYNEATNLYVGAGNNWGTHVVATTVSDAFPAVFWDQAIALSGAGDAMGNGQALPITIKKLENGNWNILHLGTNRGDRFLTSEDGNSWIDGGASRSIDFIITATTGGYTIQASNTVEAGTYFGVDEGETTHEDYEAVVLNVMNNIPAGERAVWQFLSTNYEDWLVYNARVKLFELYQEIQGSGYTVDCSAAKTVYENANATLEQVETATTELRRLYNKTKFQDVFKGASEDNPIDVTEHCLTNPDFEISTSNGQMPPGWTITITGQNCGQQNRTDTNSSTGLKITNFIEAWHPESLGNGVIAQTVYDLPMGKYVLECDASACHDPENGDGSDIVGVNLFIEAGANKVTERVGTRRLGIEHFAVTFINGDSDVLTFGLEANETNANWLSADNFKITYYGETTESIELATLKEELKKAQEIAEESDENNIQSTDNINYSAEARSALASAISQAESAISGDAAAQTAATDALKAAIEAINASKKVYAQFKTIYEEGNNTLQQLMDAGQWSDLQTDIDNFLIDDLEANFNAGSLTAEDLTSYENKISEMVREYISDPSKIQEGDVLTFLLVNPNFTTGTTTDPTGWTINSGSMTELSLATQNIETYHKAFDLSQTIPNMPAGVYDITLQGFARHDGSDTDKTWLYGGITTAQLISLNDDEEQGRDEPIYYNGSEEHPYLHDGNYDTNINSTGGWYTANGMGGSHYWFKEINPNTQEPYYTNHIEVVLAEDGDLTIGIHCESTTDWVIFSNFGITYAGQNMAIYYKMIKDKQDELKLLTEEQGIAVAEDVAKVAQEKVNFNANTVETPDEALAVIKEIEEVIAQVNECVAIYDEVASTWEYLDALANSPEVPSVSDEYITLMSNVEANKDNGYKSIQAMREDQAKLAAGWAAAVTQDLEAGDDASFAILNPHYTSFDGSASSDLFWTSTSWHGTDFFACEFFNWRNGDDPSVTEGNNLQFSHYQELNGIKPGYYTVSVQGFYRYGDYNPNTNFGTPGAGNAHADGTEVINAFLFVQSADGGNSVPLCSIFDGAQGSTLGIGSEVEAEGQSGLYIPNNMEAASAYFDQEFYTNTINVNVGEDGKLTIGINKSEAIDSDWVIFTGWKLKYLGTEEAPDAVQDLNAKTTGNAVIYGIDGRQQSQLRRGINIVRQNGSVNKVLVK